MVEPDEEMTDFRTRQTLLIRIRNPEDNRAWEDFVEIYTPLIYGFALRRGLDHGDASDVVQEVMKSVARAIRGFDYDPAKGTFRSWLFTVARNQLARHFRKRARRPSPGGEHLQEMVESTPDPREQHDWDLDYRRQMFHWAVGKVRPEFSDQTWACFEQTALEGRDPATVAAALGTTRAGVYVAKSRVTKRLREKIHSVAAESWEGDLDKDS